jgi:hypothetical protein
VIAAGATVVAGAALGLCAAGGAPHAASSVTKTNKINARRIIAVPPLLIYRTKHQGVSSKANASDRPALLAAPTCE